MKNRILVDTNFLVALSDTKDLNRQKALRFAQKNQHQRIVPDVVLTDVAYLLRRGIGQKAVSIFLKSIAESDAQLEPVTKADLRQSAEIMLKYPAANFDFVDGCIMALAERLEITQICTFDRRDFVIYRQPNGEPLDLLP